MQLVTILNSLNETEKKLEKEAGRRGREGGAELGQGWSKELREKITAYGNRMKR